MRNHLKLALLGVIVLLIAGTAWLAGLVEPATELTMRSTPSTANLRYALGQVNSNMSYARSRPMESAGFQGQCTKHEDCGVGWRCCNTSCENVDVCP